MVTAALTTTSQASGIAGTVFGIVELVVIASWALLFAVFLVYLAVLITSRSLSQRRAPVRPRAGRLPSEVNELRRADPSFDEQLLLDAAQTATLLIFAAMTIGDVAPIRRLVTDSFWRTPFGRITHMTARQRRREGADSAKNPASGRRNWNIPLDYQPSVPELTAVHLGREQRISVQIAFGQLQAIVRPGAQDFAAGAAAPNFGSAMVALGKSVSSQASAPPGSGVSWLAAGGNYDLTFVRPSSHRTDPSAALADRTCTSCGATYRSELAIACEHCRAPRALPWGTWRLAEAAPVR